MPISLYNYQMEMLEHAKHHNVGSVLWDWRLLLLASNPLATEHTTTVILVEVPQRAYMAQIVLS